jgi:DNA-binding transcriptional regulator YhcF (GntR family)
MLLRDTVSAVAGARIDELDLALDRGAEVPIGVQLVWALRARILGGALPTGARLPALHRLAEEIRVNANTIRAVYARLEHDGLVTTRHGSGTYVTAAPVRGALAELVADTEREAREAGLEPRDVAAALYVGGVSSGAAAAKDGAVAPDAVPPDAEAVERRRLRAQIAALEHGLSELLARRPALTPAPATGPAARGGGRPRLLSAAELSQQRTELLRSFAAAQAAADAADAADPADAAGKTPAARSATAAARSATTTSSASAPHQGRGAATSAKRRAPRPRTA